MLVVVINPSYWNYALLKTDLLAVPPTPGDTFLSSPVFALTVCCLRSALHPKSAALKDPEVRKEVERRLKDLERQGLLIKEASKDLETILMERRKAWGWSPAAFHWRPFTFTFLSVPRYSLLLMLLVCSVPYDMGCNSIFYCYIIKHPSLIGQYFPCINMTSPMCRDRLLFM